MWGWSNGAGGSKDFVYDELSNMLSNGSGDTFTYNAERNRLLAASLAYEGESLTYTYDQASFVTSRDGVPITWTATGRMASFGPISIEWDMQGRPLSWTVAGVTRDFTLFGGLVELDATTGAVGWLRVGLNSIPFAGSERIYRHTDFRGNVSFVSDQTGAVVTHYAYSAYGLDVVLGDASDSVRFVGRHEVGPLMILGSRIYDPVIGRFLSQDPVMPILNLYSYTFGNPVFFWDPDGLNPQAQAQLAASVAVATGSVLALNPATAPLGAALVAYGAVVLVLLQLFPLNAAANSNTSGDGGQTQGFSGGSVSVCSPSTGDRSMSWILAALLLLHLAAGASLLSRRWGEQRVTHP